MLPDVKFVFAGTGELQNKIREVDNVVELGFCSGDKLSGLIASARATVLPAIWYENGGLSNIESQLLGTPVITANIGGISERVSNGNTALLYDSGNKIQLMEKIKLLWEDESLYEQMREKCMNLRDYVEYESSVDYCDYLVNEVYR
jgi:glycosyltransferase involved in cell wall biosynthesis